MAIEIVKLVSISDFGVNVNILMVIKQFSLVYW